jgi:4-methylaminobutanoate oxidase (formaldehyde-forming)
VGLAYVDLEPGTDPLALNYEIEVAGVRYAAEASLRPMYDPENRRIRC